MFGLNRRTRWPASERRLRERAERVLTLRRSVSVPAAPANAVMLPCRMYYDRCVPTPFRRHQLGLAPCGPNCWSDKEHTNAID
jgi:uncharacterized protein (DUF1800 family)